MQTESLRKTKYQTADWAAEMLLTCAQSIVQLFRMYAMDALLHVGVAEYFVALNVIPEVIGV